MDVMCCAHNTNLRCPNKLLERPMSPLTTLICFFSYFREFSEGME